MGDLQGKSATLHEMAYIHTVRGDLDEAMRLYQESLRIKEGLGDLQGKSATLAMMGQLLVEIGETEAALAAFLESLSILVQLKAAPDANKVASIIVGFKEEIGNKEFRQLWQRVTGKSELPAWLE